MLTHSQITTLLLLRTCKDSFFYQLPEELFLKIINDDSQHSIEFKQFDLALHCAAFGELEKLKSILNANPRFIFYAGTTMTRSGLTVHCKTLLECSLGEGDDEMAKLIMSYFSHFKDSGENEKMRQIKRYRFCIENMMTENPAHTELLSKLFSEIQQASEEDIEAELTHKTEYSSELRTLLIQFREVVTFRDLRRPSMHYPFYKMLISAFNLLEKCWSTLTPNQQKLIWCQVIAFIERGAPSTLRFKLAKGFLTKLVRDTKCKNKGTFPNLSEDDFKKASGLGYDYGIYLGQRRELMPKPNAGKNIEEWLGITHSNLMEITSIPQIKLKS